MSRAFRYLGSTYLKNLLLSGGVIGLLATLGTHVAHIELFTMWYAILPMFFVIFSFVYGFTLITLYRQAALSFNCRRTDFFLGCQAAFLVAALASVLLLWVFGRLPGLLPGGYIPYEFGGGVFYGAPFWAERTSLLALSGVLLLLQPIGAALGELTSKRKALGMVLYVLPFIVATASTTMSLLLLDGSLVLPGPVVFTAVGILVALAVLCEIFFYCSNRKAIVR